FTGAKGDDIWLHARGTAGAHVILRNAKGRSPHPDALLDAAILAAHYSSAKNEGKVEIIYTEARHVKKTKGAPAGQVGVSKSKTLLVQMDAQRLQRLLAE
ncbi:MAG: NFACT RNA binding domain-containing protein, partial [Myxococcota bacterium]